MESADRARRERNITIAIGVVLVLLITAFVARNRFQSEGPPPLVTDGPVVSQADDAEALEDFLGSRAAREANAGTVTPGPVAPSAPPRRPEKIAPPTKRVEAEIAVSVGGREPATAPRKRNPAPQQPDSVPPRQTPAAPRRDEVVEPVVPTPARQVIYAVQKGDNLSKIAERFYGRASDYVLIQRANNLASANMLRLGQRLVIPSKENESPASAPAAARPQPTRASEKTYVIKKNDNLWKIATAVYGNGHKWRQILQANRNVLRSEHDLKVGQVLKIPETR